MEANRKKDIQSFDDLRQNMEKKIEDAVFNMDCKVNELDRYKTSYENLSLDIKNAK